MSVHNGHREEWRQHHFSKSTFKGCATTVITRCSNDPFHARYERLLDSGTKPTPAKAAARAGGEAFQFAP